MLSKFIYTAALTAATGSLLALPALAQSTPTVVLTRADNTVLEMGQAFKRGDKSRLTALLPQARGHALWQRDFTGSSGLFGFVLKRGTRQQLGMLLDDLDHFGIGFSWGGFESLALPVKMDGCRSVTSLDFSGPIVRLSIGLEDPADLIADLAAGLARYEALF